MVTNGDMATMLSAMLDNAHASMSLTTQNILQDLNEWRLKALDVSEAPEVQRMPTGGIPETVETPALVEEAQSGTHEAQVVANDHGSSELPYKPQSAPQSTQPAPHLDAGFQAEGYDGVCWLVAKNVAEVAHAARNGCNVYHRNRWNAVKDAQAVNDASHAINDMSHAINDTSGRLSAGTLYRRFYAPTRDVSPMPPLPEEQRHLAVLAELEAAMAQGRAVYSDKRLDDVTRGLRHQRDRTREGIRRRLRYCVVLLGVAIPGIKVWGLTLPRVVEALYSLYRRNLEHTELVKRVRVLHERRLT